MSTEPERNQTEVRFENLKSDFLHVLRIAIDAKNIAAETKTDRRGEIADTLLLRNVLTGLTISQALQTSSENGLPKLISPDFASVAVLSRTILETFLAMFNIAIREFRSDEAGLRLLWWDWHEVNEKIRALQTIRSRHSILTVLKNRRSVLSKTIAGHPYFGLIPKQLCKGFCKDEAPRQAMWESNRAIAVEAGILPEHFDVQYQFLSAVAHSQPMIVSVLRKHDPHALEAKSMMNQSLGYATAYLGLSVLAFSQKCPAANSAIDSRFGQIVKVWGGAFAIPFHGS